MLVHYSLHFVKYAEEKSNLPTYSVIILNNRQYDVTSISRYDGKSTRLCSRDVAY